MASCTYSTLLPIFFIYTRMHACTYVCVCMYMYIRICMYVCACIYTYVCMYVCMYMYIYSYMYVCMYKCMYACMHVCMCIHITFLIKPHMPYIASSPLCLLRGFASLLLYFTNEEHTYVCIHVCMYVCKYSRLRRLSRCMK